MDDMASTTTGNISQRRAHWRALVADWKASGLSQARFCRERELPVWKLRYWAKRV